MAVVKGNYFLKVKTNCFYSQLNYSLPRTAIEAEILFAARVMQTRFLGAVIKPVHPCTGLIARFAQQNALLLRTTDIRVGTEKKHRGNKTVAAKRLKRYGAAEPTGVASQQARCRYLCTFALY